MHHDDWPETIALMFFQNCQNLTISGSGIVDGLGYDWWQKEWNHTGIGDYRPKLLEVNHTSNMHLSGLEFRNSPFWTINLHDVDEVEIFDLEINTYLFKQASSVTNGYED